MGYSPGLLFIVFISAVIGIMWFVWQYKHEKRSLWLGVSFLAALATSLSLVTFLLIIVSEISFFRILLIVGAVFITFIIMLFPLVLILSMLMNGIRLIEREGASFRHMLSLGFGIAYILYLCVWPILYKVSKGGFLSFLYFYLSFCFMFTLLTFALYTVTNLLNLLKIPQKKYHYIIVLGCGLKKGIEVTPLLAGRVDKGIEAYKQNKGSILVFSGGKGADEKIAESEAMKIYAMKQGVPETSILTEDKSVNTRENLLFSKQLIEENIKDMTGNLLVVTTSYHVLRALLLAKNLKIECDGRGSRTKFYFSINAFIREWIAYLVLWRKTYLSILAGGFAFIALGYIITNFKM